MSENKINSLVPPHEMEKAFGFIRKMRAHNEKRALEMGADLKAHVLTFGCQQNEADSEKLAGMARSMGYEITSEPERADLILVNTCAV